MDKVPSYLAWYLLKIRRHSDKQGYLVTRFEGMSEKKMSIEVQMLEEMLELHLVILPDEAFQKAFKPDGQTEILKIDEPLFRYPKGTVFVRFRGMFSIAPRGHYFIRETIVQFFAKGIWTAIVALLGILVGLAIGT